MRSQKVAQTQNGAALLVQEISRSRSSFIPFQRTQDQDQVRGVLFLFGTCFSHFVLIIWVIYSYNYLIYLIYSPKDILETLNFVWLKYLVFVYHDFMTDFLDHHHVKAVRKPLIIPLHHLLWKSPSYTILPFSSLFVEAGCDGQMGSGSVMMWLGEWRGMTTKTEMWTEVITMMRWPGTMLSQMIIVIPSLTQW